MEPTSTSSTLFGSQRSRSLLPPLFHKRTGIAIGSATAFALSVLEVFPPQNVYWRYGAHWVAIPFLGAYFFLWWFHDLREWIHELISTVGWAFRVAGAAVLFAIFIGYIFALYMFRPGDDARAALVQRIVRVLAPQQAQGDTPGGRVPQTAVAVEPVINPFTALIDDNRRKDAEIAQLRQRLGVSTPAAASAQRATTSIESSADLPAVTRAEEAIVPEEPPPLEQVNPPPKDPVVTPPQLSPEVIEKFRLAELVRELNNGMQLRAEYAKETVAGSQVQELAIWVNDAGNVIASRLGAVYRLRFNTGREDISSRIDKQAILAEMDARLTFVQALVNDVIAGRIQ
jgi:hypothetical protein